MARRAVLGVVAVLLVIAAAYGAFYIAPEERTMGFIQKIFYLHAPAAWAGMDVFFVCFVANILYVWKREKKYDWLGVATAEVGLAFTTIVLITGPIWAHPVWGIWWTWDARLTSTFVLWLLYVSYLLLRMLVEEPERRAMLSAVFGILAFLDVPLVYGSIRWWRTQHPQPVILGEPGSGLEPTMAKVFFFSVLAMHVLALFLIVERYVLEKMRAEFTAVEVEWEAR
jgi:heme exporter protein C